VLICEYLNWDIFDPFFFKTKILRRSSQTGY